jgi:LPPG:FO 2-phospho-L-lactate transferase
MLLTALAGGVGAAKFLRGLVAAVDPAKITVIGNTGDDADMYGLHVSPDLDIVTYTLAGIVGASGWGIASDTTHALDQLATYGFDTWFELGDRDIGTSMARTRWLSEGLSLSEVTDRLRRALGVGCRIVPMTDDPVSTRVRTMDGVLREFQEYFVKLRHSVAVSEVCFEGAARARPAPGVLESIEAAERILICPSNPVLSIGPILSVRGIREALVRRRPDVYAISPIVAGTALKGPAATLMPVVGVESSAAGVAALYRDFCGTLVIDTADAGLAPAVEELGVRAMVAPTVMTTMDDSLRLSRELLAS